MQLMQPKVEILMFLDSAAKNYPEILRDQNKYATFDILANPTTPCPDKL